MTNFGADKFWWVVAALMFAISLYGLYRVTQRVSLYKEEADDFEPVPYAPVTAATTVMTADVAVDYYAEGDAEEGTDPDMETGFLVDINETIPDGVEVEDPDSPS